MVLDVFFSSAGAADSPAAALVAVLTLDVFFGIVCNVERIHARPLCTHELVTVFITKGSCQNNVEVPSVVKARLASSPWELPTQ